MASQTLSIVNNLDDGYESGGSWNASQIFFGGSDAGGFSFLLTSQIDAGSTVDSAYFRAYRLATESGGGSPVVSVENADPATVPRFSATHMPLSQSYYSVATGASINWVDYRNQYVLGPGDALELAITAAIQSLVTDYGQLNVGDRINISLTGTGYFANVEDLNAAGGHPAQLVINWTAGGGGGGGSVLSSRLSLLGVGR
jgi:hypothetical protein